MITIACNIRLLTPVVTVFLAALVSMAQPQDTFKSNTHGWTVEISKEWNVLGPFPIHAREQHYLSPSFPLNVSYPINFDETYPSSYADHGTVRWSTAHMSDDGELRVSFPQIRWASIRATEGWAAVQHHSVLRTTVTVFPPTSAVTLDTNLQPSPRLVVNLLQGSFFTVIPRSPEHRKTYVPEWYMGNIYAMERSPPQIVELPLSPSDQSPSTYDLFVSGDYEIRLFGDPKVTGSDTPTLTVNLSVDLEIPTNEVIWESSQDVTCDFVDGHSFGEALGVGLRSVAGWWTVERVEFADDCSGEAISLGLIRHTRLAPTQMRIVPLQLKQLKPFYMEKLSIIFTVHSAQLRIQRRIPVTLSFKHHKTWSPSEFAYIKASYFYVGSMPTSFLVTPPIEPHADQPHLPILALHGAGVDIFSQLFWAESIPRQKHRWIVMPSGRTAWGLDWHGPSAQDAWQSLDSLASILANRVEWYPWRLRDNTRAIVIGHSNGGQGAWYLASRYPDRVAAAVPAAAYIKSQAYVPLTESRFAHYIDPSVRAILETSLTPDDNDLFLSNVVHTPILAIHGGDDENVPVWQTREAVAVVKTWAADAPTRYKEDPGQPHWYPSVFSNAEVQTFLDNVPEERSGYAAYDRFTLTVSIPSESGSFHGWRIERLKVPGRLARLTVEVHGEQILISTINVQVFSLAHPGIDISDLNIDGFHVRAVPNSRGILRLNIGDTRAWQLADTATAQIQSQPLGRIVTTLASSRVLSVCVPDNSSRELSLALRLAHDFNLYHRLDVEIFPSAETPEEANWDIPHTNNLLMIGSPQTTLLQRWLAHRKTAFYTEGDSLWIRGHRLNQWSTGAMFMHPPMDRIDGHTLLWVGNDESGLERISRIFPMRTGIPVPDWLVVGDRADSVGAAGIQGLGVWNTDWTWSAATCWLT